MSPLFLISIVFVLISMLVSYTLKRKFTSYSKDALWNSFTGKEIAEKMLRDNGIYDVQVVSVSGFLSDHYNPLNKTVNLSPDVYNGSNIAAAAVAAHECGHVLQHSGSYPWLMLRTRLVPVVQVSSYLIQFVLIAGILLINTFPSLLLIGIGLFAVITLFSFITLPVEFDASRRALAWLNQTNIVVGQQHEKAKDALKWAALTYVVAAIASLVTLLEYIFIYSNRRS